MAGSGFSSNRSGHSSAVPPSPAADRASQAGIPGRAGARQAAGRRLAYEQPLVVPQLPQT